MSNWVLDALKEPFQKKGNSKKEITDEEKLKQIEELKKQLAQQEESIMANKKDSSQTTVQEVKTIKVEEPPKIQEQPQELSIDSKLMLMERNFLNIANDLNDRLSAVERAVIKLLNK